MLELGTEDNYSILRNWTFNRVYQPKCLMIELIDLVNIATLKIFFRLINYIC